MHEESTLNKTKLTHSRIFYGYWILLVGFICQIIMNGCVPYAFSLFVLPIDKEFGWSRAAIMTGNMVASLITGFASPFIGKFIYRLGAKWVIAGGALIMGTGLILLAITQSLWQFYLFYAIVGIGAAATGVVPTSMVIANWFKKRRGFAIGILGMGIGVGGFVIPLVLGTYVIPTFGWRIAYVVSGIISAVVLIPLSLFLIRSRPEEMGLLPDNGEVGESKHGRVSNTPEPGLTTNEALKTPAFWLMVVAFTTFSLANAQIFQNHAPHLQNIGFSAETAAIAISVVGIGSAIGKFGFGWLGDFIRPKYILIIGCALQVAASLVLLSVTPDSPMFMVWLYAILLGLGVGSWLPALSINTSVTFGLLAYGVIFGTYNLLFQTGNAIGPWIGGFIFDTTGSYRLAFQLSLILYAIAVPCMLFVRRPKVNKK